MKNSRFINFALVAVLFMAAFFSLKTSDIEYVRAENLSDADMVSKQAESDSIYVSTVYNEESGLPTSEANTLIQTSDGYIWIGSYGGLIRYDGVNFTNYSTEGRIESSSIRSLFQDSKGWIWIGTNEDGMYVYKSDSFIKIHNEDEHSFRCARAFAETSDGRIYVASNSGVAEVSSLWVKPLKLEEMNGEVSTDISCDCYDRLWVANQSGNVFIIQNDKVFRKFSSSDFIDEGYINCVEYGNRFIYMGTSGAEMIRLSMKTDNIDEDLAMVRFDTKGVGAINNITTRSNGEVLVSGLDGFGVMDFYHNFTKISEFENAISANCATIDYEGNYWVASSSYGIIRFTKGCFRSFNRTAGLGDVTINAITGNNGLLYMGTDKGLIICDENWNRVENSLTEKLADLRIRCVTNDPDGNVWIATYSPMGAVKYNPLTDSITCFGTGKGVLGEKVRVIYAMQNGTVAVGTQMGVTLIKNGKVQSVYNAGSGLENTTILCFMESDGALYIGTDGAGIYVLREGKLSNLSYAEGLDNLVVLRLVPDAENSGCFYACTGDSLFYYEGSSFKKIELTSKGAGSIYDIYDRDGKLWILQNAGIFAGDKKSALEEGRTDLTCYGSQHGLSGTLSANTWNYMDENGQLFMSTRNGVSIFDFVCSEIVMPKGIVSSINVDGEEYEHPNALTISKDTQRLTINFSALSFTDTSKVKIGYKLDGFDLSEMITTEKSNIVSYTNLPGGKYKFIMKIYNPVTDEVTAEISTVIEKRKKPMEYLTVRIAVYFLIICVIVGMVFLMLRAWLRGIRNHQRELTELSEQALLTVARTIDAKDQYTKGHSVRVAIYSREMAKRMGMNEDEQQRIYYIGLLHDVGKIGIPDGILNKPGRLTDEEREVIKHHPKIGGQILENFTAVAGIADGAKYHHERYDGTGYNEGKKGDKIPLIARIICVADSYDAMSSNRCYRKGLSNDVIAEELKKCSGTQFDPAIVPIMLAMMEEGAAPVYDE